LQIRTKHQDFFLRFIFFISFFLNHPNTHTSIFQQVPIEKPKKNIFVFIRNSYSIEAIIIIIKITMISLCIRQNQNRQF
jgi:hypothetical protein